MPPAWKCRPAARYGKQKKKHNRNIYIVLAVVLCLAGVFFVKDAVRAVEEMAYPRTYAALVQQYAAEYLSLIHILQWAVLWRFRTQCCTN